MSTSILKGARHFKIGKVEVSGQQGDALEKLCNNIASGALLNSKERSDTPMCLPETRVAVQRELVSFITDEDATAQPRRILWLTGPAGSGKTTIMNTIGQQFQRQGKLAAAHFFSSFSPSLERKTKDRFVTTLAYQIILHDALQGVRDEVLSSIAKNPAIFKMSLQEQMEVLILRPLRLHRTLGGTLTPPKVILVDGIDECGINPPGDSPQVLRDAARLSREMDQIEVLQVLLEASSDPAFPFHIIIASRSEPAIDEFFFTSAKTQSTTIFLDNKYNPNADIALFLNSRFATIRRQHRLPPSWPGADVVSKLVDIASGQMIYAATVIRFVETPSKSPRMQLEIILKTQRSNPPSSSNPLHLLDALYSQVLNSTPNPKAAFMWLKAYHLLNVEEGIETWCLNRLCESSEGEVDRLFASMSALVFSSNQDDIDSARYTFFHKSFQDFLRDHSRSDTFFSVTDEDVRRWLLERFVEAFERKRPARALTNDLAAKFGACVIDLWHRLVHTKMSQREFYAARPSRHDAEWWLSNTSLRKKSGRGFTMFMFVASHKKCLAITPCLPDCKL